MCETCGCSPIEHDDVEPELHAHHPHHHHDHPHHHHDHPHHHHDHGERRLTLQEKLLQKNDALARDNRRWLVAHGSVAVNLMSSPGSGKTTLLERTLRDHGSRREIVVIQGDQATNRDAERVRQAGARALQINTGTGCHLDATMVARALRELSPRAGAIVAIENVGNLVCPALFDLGEQARVAIVSVTEGADKPLKYPYMFRDTELVVLNKIDLLPYVDFDLDLFEACLKQVAAHVRTIRVSATRGDGMSSFYAWLDELAATHAGTPPGTVQTQELR